MSAIALIYSPFPDAEVAARVAKTLLESRQIACANILPEITSIFRWEENICREQEVLLLAKTTIAMAEAACDALQALHPYDIPAILRLEHVRASADYAAWVAKEVISSAKI